jgi:hypothetical protein
MLDKLYLFYIQLVTCGLPKESEFVDKIEMANKSSGRLSEIGIVMGAPSDAGKGPLRSAKLPECATSLTRRLQYSLLLVVFLGGFCLDAEQLPWVTAETLAGNKLELPVALVGKLAVLCIGFTHPSQSEVKNWTTELQRQFKKDSGVAIYSIAVLEDAPRIVRGMILHAMKKGVPSAEFGEFLVIYQNEKELKQSVGFEARDDAYVIVLDPTGAVRYKLHGDVNATSTRDLNIRVASILGESMLPK